MCTNSVYLEDGEAHLSRPRTHYVLDWPAASRGQRRPQVLSEGVTVLVAVQVQVHPLAETLWQKLHFYITQCVLLSHA